MGVYWGLLRGIFLILSSVIFRNPLYVLIVKGQRVYRIFKIITFSYGHLV